MTSTCELKEEAIKCWSFHIERARERGKGWKSLYWKIIQSGVINIINKTNLGPPPPPPPRLCGIHFWHSSRDANVITMSKVAWKKPSRHTFPSSSAGNFWPSVKLVYIVLCLCLCVILSKLNAGGRYSLLFPANLLSCRCSTSRASWALAHPSPQVLSFLGTQLSTYIMNLSTQVLKWVQNWACKLNFLGSRPALCSSTANIVVR